MPNAPPLDNKIDPELFVSSQVAQGLAEIGDRWAFLIIRDIYLGICRFEDLRRSLGTSRGTLASRLKSLLNKKILFKQPYQHAPPRYEYCLTEKGLGLYPIVLMMWKWEHKWGNQHYLPKSLKHTQCGHNMEPIYKCKECREELKPQQIDFSLRPDFDTAQQVAPRVQRRTKSTLEKSGDMDSDNMSVLDCVGDRWTSLVLAAGFFGLQRFDSIAKAIGIGTSVLADRLDLLVKTGVMNRMAYQQRPARYEYRLSAKGRDLYGHIIAIHEWTERWLIRPERGLLKLQHRPCNAVFRGEAVCSHCDEALHPLEVSYSRS